MVTKRKLARFTNP